MSHETLNSWKAALSFFDSSWLQLNLLLWIATRTFSQSAPQWTWLCHNEEHCKRYLTSETAAQLQSLATCNMLCTSTQLWPQPTGNLVLANKAVSVRAENFSLQIESSPSQDVSEYLHEAFGLLRREKRAIEQGYGGTLFKDNNLQYIVVVRVKVNGSRDLRMRLDTDESYKIDWKPEQNTIIADISATTFCGARHAFETLSQTIWLDPYKKSLQILQAGIVEDAPRFRYRGLLLDTSRNYFPIGELLRTVDAMSASKLNTLHWHVSDSQSFPLKLDSVPQLAEYGAYGLGSVYTTKEVEAIVHHAGLRGIRVVLEIDTPAHIGRAWNWGVIEGLGNMAFCVEEEPWTKLCGEPPCGQLNPRNPYVYSTLQKIYAEIIKLTKVDDIFHLGGDEISKECWLKYFNDTNPLDAWYDFTQRALNSLILANGGKAPAMTLLWSSSLTRSSHFRNFDLDLLGVHLWSASKSEDSQMTLEAGIRTVLSQVDVWHLDCGYGSWRDNSDGHCGPYRSWQQMYEYHPWADVPLEESTNWRIEGGTVCQWTEQLSPNGLDERVWPRAAAVAERLWSDHAGGADADVYVRLDTHRARLVARGVRAASIWPRWCSHNPHACVHKLKEIDE